MLGSSAPVKVSVYDVTGRRVAALVDAVQRAGIYTPTWDGTNAEGTRVAAGTYFIRIEARGESAEQKVICIR